ncbi:MAG: hypothetical protein QOG08_771 [Chloroflexota bacterium]|jgi:hypothetical protein|nr:hypothetical protein [Chloroflexota bacterium]
MRSVKITADCGSVTDPTAATIDQIARLMLAARRCGCELEVKDASPELLELISFVGLSGVLLVEARRQTEQRKQPGSVEEERELSDPPSG